MFVLSLTYLCWVVKDATNIFDNNMGFLLRPPILIGHPPPPNPTASVTRLGDLLDFGQPFKAFANN